MLTVKLTNAEAELIRLAISSYEIQGYVESKTKVSAKDVDLAESILEKIELY